jgi:capsular polysaccharide biosynthesis protein
LEPISYLKAPLRRWPVVVALVVILAIVAVVIPYSSKSGKYPANTYEAVSDVGLTPGFTQNKLGAKVSEKQLEFFVHEPAVLAAAAKKENVKVTKKLENDVVITRSKKKGSGGAGGKSAKGIIGIAVLQRKKKEAADFTNAFVASLDSYTTVQLEAQQKQAIAAENTYIQNLETAIQNIHHKKPTTTSSTTTTTTHPKTVPHHAHHGHSTHHTTTTTSHPKHKAAPNAPSPSNSANNPGSSTTQASTSSTTQASASGTQASASLSTYSSSSGTEWQQPRIVLVEASPTTSSSTVTSPTSSSTLTSPTSSSTVTTPTIMPTSPVPPVVIVSPNGATIPGQFGVPTTTTTEPFGKLLQTEQLKVLSSQLAQSKAALVKLQSEGAPNSGIRVVSPATPQGAKKLNKPPSILGSRKVRLGLGLVAGAILGILAAWLLEGLDRRLRTSKRAEQVFGLPVVVEVPGSNAKTLSVIPVVDIVVDPFSDASEAYRKLHVAIMNAPTVTWVRRGSGYEDEPWGMPYRPPAELPPAPPVPAATAPPGAAAADAPNAGDTGEPSSATTSPMRLPVAARAGTLVAPRRERFSILVTSPTDEPTRSLVVVNLAAVFAEAGDRVLVATTGGMRTEVEGNGKGPKSWEGPDEEMDASELVANARPSQIPGVSSLALGQVFTNPSRFALQAPALVEAARDVVDVLLLEAPLLTTQDGAALLPAADLVVVVCEAWRTTVADGVRTQRLLAQRRPPVLGMVMTAMPPEKHSIHARS